MNEGMKYGPTFAQMPLFFLFVVMLFPGLGAAQEVKIDTFKIKLAPSLADNSEAELHFPQLMVPSKTKSRQLNQALKDQFTNKEYVGRSIETSIRYWGQNVSYLDFDVLYNEKDMVSIAFEGESCGAHCEPFSIYHTFKVSSLQFLSLHDLVDTLGDFRRLAYQKMDSLFVLEHEKLKDWLQIDSGLVDSSYYIWAKEALEECQANFKLNEFSVVKDGVLLRQNCSFPHVIYDKAPKLEVKFEWVEIRKYLKIKGL
jgi:hypothetical protein